MTLNEAKSELGSRVVYVPFDGCGPSQYEYGKITSIRNDFVFVRYDGDEYGKATPPEKLTLIGSKVQIGELAVRYESNEQNYLNIGDLFVPYGATEPPSKKHILYHAVLGKQITDSSYEYALISIKKPSLQPLRFLLIIDIGKGARRSVTNDMENVLDHIKNREGLDGYDEIVVFAKDTYGEWDSIEYLNNRVEFGVIDPLNTAALLDLVGKEYDFKR